MLDTVYRIATPEGVELQLGIAGPVPRALAWLLDFLLRLVIILVSAPMLTKLGDLGTGLLLLLWFALEWLAPAYCEQRWGATPGKKALGLIVVRDDGAPLQWGPAMTRNLLRAADFLPLFYLGGLLTMLSNRRFKRLGDYVAGTLVVYADTKTEARHVPRLDPLLPTVALNVDDARTVLDFAERAPLLGDARASEIAEWARVWLRPDGGTPTRQLTGIANHLVGPAPERHATN